MFTYGRHYTGWRIRTFHVAIPLNPFRPRRWLSVELVRLAPDTGKEETSGAGMAAVPPRQSRPVEPHQLLEEHMIRQAFRRYM